MTKRAKRPRDPAQLGQTVVDIAKGHIGETTPSAKQIRAQKLDQRAAQREPKL
jgi:hypothetical protein